MTYIDRPGPEKELLLVLKFFRFPTLLDKKNVLLAVNEKPLRKKDIFWKNFTNLIASFLRSFHVLISPKPFWKAAAVVGNLFLKPRKVFEVTNKSY